MMTQENASICGSIWVFHSDFVRGYVATIFTFCVMQVVNFAVEKIVSMDRMFIVSCDLSRSEKNILFLSVFEK